MDIKKLHDKFKNQDSPSVEGQIRWLQKQGFSQDHIDRAMLDLYTDIEQGRMPQVFEREENGKIVEWHCHKPEDTLPPFFFTRRSIANGMELDQALLEYAKRIRTTELSQAIENLQAFEKKLRKKWASQVPWYKRVVGIKPQEQIE
jgi:hypothetical protein